MTHTCDEDKDVVPFHAFDDESPDVDSEQKQVSVLAGSNRGLDDLTWWRP